MREGKFYKIEEIEALDIKEIQDLYKEYINPNQTKIFSALPFGNDVFNKAEGVFMYTSKGKKILDFTGGLGVLGLGHNHPKILKARLDFQANKKVEVHKIIFSKYMAALSNNLSYLLPENLKKSFFLNSGAEAVEAAIKVCFKSFSKRRKYILYSDRSYHGKLIGSGSISGSYYKENQFPKMENCVMYKFNDIKDIEDKIKKFSENGGIYTIIIEPFSASTLEPTSKEFMEKLFNLKKNYNFKIIFDEVFTGFYKSEKMFCFQTFDEKIPDVLCLSKTLGGGKSSISSLIIDDDTYKSAYSKINETFLHTTTYNGFGEESVTALAALDIISEKNFKKRVLEISKLLKSKLNNLKEKHPKKIEKIKGNGLLNGIIFSSYISEIGNLIENIPLQVINDKSSFLRKITATAISAELYEKYNILTAINDSKFSDHLCVSPSLIISDENIEYFFKSLDEVLQKNINLKFLPVILNFLKS